MASLVFFCDSSVASAAFDDHVLVLLQVDVVIVKIVENADCAELRWGTAWL